jgi:rubrerythrin
MDQQQYEIVFATAISREIEAHEFYRDVAQRAQNSDVKEVFARLAEEELGHKELLEKFKYDPTMVMQIQAPPDYKVAEATPLPALSIDMKPADAIALAMKKEQQAVEFYRGLGEQATEQELKKVFANLANMELNHKHRLENVFVEIGYPEAF